MKSLLEILEEEIFPKIKNHDMNILVADDNSPDGTAEIVRILMQKMEESGIKRRRKTRTWRSICAWNDLCNRKNECRCNV